MSTNSSFKYYFYLNLGIHEINCWGKCLFKISVHEKEFLLTRITEYPKPLNAPCPIKCSKLKFLLSTYALVNWCCNVRFWQTITVHVFRIPTWYSLLSPVISPILMLTKSRKRDTWKCSSTYAAARYGNKRHCWKMEHII